MLQQAQRLYEFGPYRLNPAQQLLTGDGKKIPLTPKAFQTLLVLVENRDRVVEKEELLQKVWPDTFVEEATLAQNVFTLRKQLEDNSGEAQYIETVPKRGYRFVAKVRVAEPAASTPESQRRTEIRPQLVAPTHQPARTPRIAWIFAVVVIAAAAIWYGIARLRTARPAPSERIMLVVLPVQNLTGDGGQEYLADGLTEEIIADLGSLNPERLGVIARTSAMAYKQTKKTVQEIGKELAVDYVLETSLREGSGNVRFTAQLIRIQDQTHVWAHNYDRPMADILALQGELARTIADEIRIDLPRETAARLASPHPVQPDAYDAYVRGRYHWNERTAGEVRTAIQYFQQAIARDPGFALAYSSLADSYVLLTEMREEPPSEMMPKAKDAVLKALALDDSLSDAHTVLGEITDVSAWDFAGAEKAFRRAIELDPNNSNAHHQYAIHLAILGRFPEAIEEIRRGQQVDPISPVMFSSMGWIYLRGHQPDKAISECRKSLDMDANYVRGHLCIGEAYEEKLYLQKAAEEFLQGKVLGGLAKPQLDELKQGLEKSGYVGYFRIRIRQLQAGKEYVSPYDMADLTLRIGDKEGALKWLQTAYAEHSPYLVFLAIEPRMDSLRSDPRFQVLIRRIGLAGIRVTPLAN
jgi:TolB-like protein/DNA-binding winged helix-turn-helix (wHTH) protein